MKYFIALFLTVFSASAGLLDPPPPILTNSNNINGVGIYNTPQLLSKPTRPIYIAAGDSITAGSGASAYTNCYVNIFANSNNFSVQNMGVGGSVITDIPWQLWGGTSITNSGVTYMPPVGVTNNQLRTIFVGYNDNRYNGTDASHLTNFFNVLLATAVWATTPVKLAASNAVTISTWTYTNLLGGAEETTNPAGTITFTNFGDKIFVAYMSTYVGTNDFGAISVNVDGTNFGLFSATNCQPNQNPSGQPAYQLTGSSNVWCAPNVAVIDLGQRNGQHVTTVTASGAGTTNPSCVFWCAGNGQPISVLSNPMLIIGEPYTQTNWSLPGSFQGNMLYCQQIDRVYAFCQYCRLPVQIAHIGQTFNPAINLGPDGVHPSNSGHQVIANVIQDAYQREGINYNASTPRVALMSGATVGDGAVPINNPSSCTLNFPAGSSIGFNSVLTNRTVAYFTNSAANGIGQFLAIDAMDSSGGWRQIEQWQSGFPYVLINPMKTGTTGVGAAGDIVQTLMSAANSSGDVVNERDFMTNNTSGTGGISLCSIGESIPGAIGTGDNFLTVWYKIDSSGSNNIGYVTTNAIVSNGNMTSSNNITTLTGTFNGNAAGVTNMLVFFQTNFVTGLVYTNSTTRTLNISSPQVLNPTSVSGNCEVDFKVSTTAGTPNVICSRVGGTTIIGSLAQTVFGTLSAWVPPGATWCVTNNVSGGLNSAAIDTGSTNTVTLF